MGSTTDKTIVRFDRVATGLRDGDYANHTAELFDKDGNIHNMNGCYVINDNGYHKWSTMMEPSKHATSHEEIEWSEMLESLRKDVECAFGILKAMFAILKYGARVTQMETMDDIFITCCSIYNQRMRQLGKDEAWENVLNRTNDDSDEEVGFFNRMLALHADVPEADVGLPEDVDVAQEHVEIGPMHDSRKTMLINHFSYCAKHKMIKWPRQNQEWHTYNPKKRQLI
jgi:hypothetical protein